MYMKEMEYPIFVLFSTFILCTHFMEGVSMRKQRKQAMSLKEFVGKMKHHNARMIFLTALIIAVICGAGLAVAFPVLARGTVTKEKETVVQVGEPVNLDHTETMQQLEEISAYLTELEERLTEGEADMSSLRESMEGADLSGMSDSLTSVESSITDTETRILSTQERIRELQELLQQNSETDREYITSEFSEISESLTTVMSEYERLTEGMQVLREQIQSSESENKEEILKQLSDLQSKLEKDTDGKLESIRQQMQQASDAYKEQLEKMQANLDDSIGKINTNMNDSLSSLNTTVNDSLTNLNTNVKDSITNLNTDVSNQYEDLSKQQTSNYEALITYQNNEFTKIYADRQSGTKELMERIANLENSLNGSLSQVFTSVSNGKQKLASALLTKNMEVSEDATFEQIAEAIQNIPQELVIGVQEIPGQVQYEFHDHSAGDGSHPGTEKVGTELQGGCFVTPIYHVHSGTASSGDGCYTEPVYHSHGSGCYTTIYVSAKTSNRVKQLHYANGEQYYDYYCDECGSTFMSVNGWHQCARNVLACSKTEGGLDYYEPGCGMTEETVVGYSAGCGYVDHQITAAHITYSTE